MKKSCDAGRNISQKERAHAGHINLGVRHVKAGCVNLGSAAKLVGNNIPGAVQRHRGIGFGLDAHVGGTALGDDLGRALEGIDRRL